MGRGGRVYQTLPPLETPNMTDRLSPIQPDRQHPEPEERASIPLPPSLLRSLLPFDLHAEDVDSPATLPLPGGPVGDDDGDEFDHDRDTDLEGDESYADEGDAERDDGDDDPPPAASGALGLPCHSDVSRGPKSPPYTLCVVSLCDDDPEEVQDGQDLIGLQTRAMAHACCDGFALRPDMIATRFKVDPGAYTHLVVNDHIGREVCRRPLLAAA
jgi:hypothetical protein